MVNCTIRSSQSVPTKDAYKTYNILTICLSLSRWQINSQVKRSSVLVCKDKPSSYNWAYCIWSIWKLYAKRLNRRRSWVAPFMILSHCLTDFPFCCFFCSPIALVKQGTLSPRPTFFQTWNRPDFINYLVIRGIFTFPTVTAVWNILKNK